MIAEGSASASQELTVIGPASEQKEAKPEEAQVLLPMSSKGGITPLPLTETLREIRQIKSEAAMLLLCSHASRLESDLQESRKATNEAQQKSENWMESYYREKERAAVLTTTLSAVSSKKNFQKFVGAIGGVVAGVSIPFLITGPVGWGQAGSITGALLLVVGFWPSGFKETKK